MAQQGVAVLCLAMTLSVCIFYTAGMFSATKTFFLQEYLRQASVRIICIQELDVGPLKLLSIETT